VDVIAALLAIASLAAALSAIGILAPGSVYRRLHYLAPAATIGVAAVALAIVLAEGFGQMGIKALLTGAVLFVMNPILTHATARGARNHERGRWDR
jgi:multicomponent Na+:H+ antiporter subunit G